MIGKILVVDDQKAAMENSVEAISSLVPEGTVITADTAAKAIRLLAEESFAVVFLDIDMPDADGFTMAEYIGTHYPALPYVFLTGYANFAAKSYDYEPLDFLTKPINIVRLQRTFEKLEKKSGSAPLGKVGVETSGGFVLLQPENIKMIVKEHRKVKICCEDGTEYVVNHSMDELEVILADFDFFRCHQSYLVALQKISGVKSSSFGQTYEAVLTSGEKVPVSRARFLVLKKLLAQMGVSFV